MERFQVSGFMFQVGRTVVVFLCSWFLSLASVAQLPFTTSPEKTETRNGNKEFKKGNYTDAEANFIIQGQLFDTRQRRNLTEERIDKLTARIARPVRVRVRPSPTPMRITTDTTIAVASRLVSSTPQNSLARCAE